MPKMTNSKRIWATTLVLMLAGLSFGIWFLLASEAGSADGLNRQAGLEGPTQADAADAGALAQMDETLESGLDVGERGDLPKISAMREVIDPALAVNRVIGRVTDEGDKPVPHFELTIRAKSSAPGEVSGEVFRGEFSNGRFEVNGLDSGRYRIEATSAGFLPSKSIGFRVPLKASRLSKNQAEGGLLIRLSRGAQLSGMVFDPDGQPIAGAEVRMRGSASAKPMMSDEQGHFAGTVPPGLFHVQARHGTFAGSEETQQRFEAGQTVELRLDLRRGGRVEGEVLDSDNEGLAGWWISIRGARAHHDTRQLHADETGRFVVEHLAPGTYWAESREHEKAAFNGKPIRAAFEISVGETTTLVLGGRNERAVRLTGTLLRAGQPAPALRLWANLEGEQAFSSGMTTTSDAAGRFELEFPGPGRAAILVAPAESLMVPLAMDLPDKRHVERDIEIPVGSVSGRVIAVDRKSKRKPFVSLSPEDRSPLATLYLTRSQRCNADGSFSFEHLPAGSYRVECTTRARPKSRS